MTQLALDFAADTGRTCAFGTPWPHNHRGYTLREWRKAGHPAETWREADGWGT